MYRLHLWPTFWCVVACFALCVTGCTLFDGPAAQQPSGAASPATTTTTSAPAWREILGGKPNEGTAGSSSAVVWYGAVVAAGVGMMFVPAVAAYGIPVAAAGASGGLWSLGIAQHGALLGWLVVLGIIAFAVVAFLRMRSQAKTCEAMAVAPMHALEEHKDALLAVPADPARPSGETLWDRLTASAEKQYAKAGVSKAADAVLERLGYKAPPGA